MADVSRPVERKIADAVERMRKVQEAAKGLREPDRVTPRVEDATQSQRGTR